MEQLQILNTVFQNPIETYETQFPVLFDSLENVVTNHPLLKTKVMPHQERMIKAMCIYQRKMQEGYDCPSPTGTLHHLKGKIGILGDMPGYGKTLSALGFLAAKRPTTGQAQEYDPESTRFFFSHTVKAPQDVSAVSLVVVPPHLLQQWRDETATHTHMTPFVIDNRRLLRNRTTPEGIRRSPFVLTTSKLYKDVYDYLATQQVALQYVFFDEAANLYLGPNDPVPDAEFVWLISSHWLCFLFKNTYLNHASLTAVRGHFQLHKDAERWLDAVHMNGALVSTTLEASSFFKHLIPFQHPCRGAMILRNSTQLVLPPLQEHAIECSTRLTLATIPPALLGTNFEGLTHERIPKLFRALDIPTWTLDQIVSHHSERSGLILNKASDSCSICLEAPQNKVFLSCCMNLFCGACILRQLLTHPQCPTCRALLFFPNMLYVRDGVQEAETLKSRPEACVAYLMAHPNESHIVYTAFDNTFYQIQHLLGASGIVCEQLDSNPGKFNRTISNFNKGLTKVLVVSSLRQIQGVTLSKASHLIFFYELSSCGQGQTMIHSAHRLGREGPLTLVQLRGGFD